MILANHFLKGILEAWHGSIVLGTMKSGNRLTKGSKNPTLLLAPMPGLITVHYHRLTAHTYNSKYEISEITTDDTSSSTSRHPQGNLDISPTNPNRMPLSLHNDFKFAAPLWCA